MSKPKFKPSVVPDIEYEPAPPGLAEVRKLLGDGAVLLPCEYGHKKPRQPYKDITLERTHTPTHEALLDLSNIAVLVGPKSGGLIAIDFDVDENYEAFRALNPWLDGTLRTKGARGCQIWLRMKGPYPELTGPYKDGRDPPQTVYEWRGGNNGCSTIWGRHPNGMLYQWLSSGPPMEAKFPDIKWPEGWQVPPMKAVESDFEIKHGRAFVYGKKGQIMRLNHNFFAAKYAAEHDILYDVRGEMFHNYYEENGLWKRTHRALVRERLKEDAGKFIDDEIEAKPDDADQLKDVKSMFTHPALDSMAGTLGDYIATEATQFDARPRALHFANCMVEIDPPTFEMKPFSKDYYSRNQCPIKYDPEAQCPNFIEKLLKPAMSDDDIDLLQAWFGQAIYGYNLHQVLLMLVGTSGGGKGAIVNIISEIIGRHNIGGLRTKHLEDRFEYSLMMGKTLLYGPDVKADFFNTDGASNIKSLVGGDPLPGEIKGGGSTEGMMGTFNALCTCNTRLTLKLEGDAPAWQRRILMINYENNAPEDINRDLTRESIDNEGPGIVNWCVTGLKRCFAAASAGRPFPQSEAQRAQVADMINESDSVRLFITTRVQRTKIFTDIITSERLYSEFLTMCEEEGWVPLTQHKFYLKVTGDMSSIHHAQYDKHLTLPGGRTGRGWKGVIFTALNKPETPSVADEDPY